MISFLSIRLRESRIFLREASNGFFPLATGKIILIWSTFEVKQIHQLGNIWKLIRCQTNTLFSKRTKQVQFILDFSFIFFNFLINDQLLHQILLVHFSNSFFFRSFKALSFYCEVSKSQSCLRVRQRNRKWSVHWSSWKNTRWLWQIQAISKVRSHFSANFWATPILLHLFFKFFQVLVLTVYYSHGRCKVLLIYSLRQCWPWSTCCYQLFRNPIRPSKVSKRREKLTYFAYCIIVSKFWLIGFLRK